MFKWNFFGRAVARFMVVSMAVLPLHEVIAQPDNPDAITLTGTDAQQLGKDLISGFNNAPSQIDGNTITLPSISNGQFDMSSSVNINTSDLFPGTSSSSTDPMSRFFPDGVAPNVQQIKGTHENADDMDDLGNNAQSVLWGDANSANPSIQGAAFKVVQDMTNRSRPDLVNDPVLNVTKDIYANIDDIATEFGDCSTETNFLDSTLQSHVPDYKTCERVIDKTTDCSVNHIYDASVVKHHDGPFNLNKCGDDCLQVWIGKVGDNYWSGHCTIYESFTEVKVVNPEAVVSATLEYAKYDDYMQVWVGEPGSETKVWSGPNGNFPPETGGACELATSWEQNPNIDLTQHFKNIEPNSVVRFKIRVSVAGAGEGFGRIKIKYDPSRAVYIDEWHPSECIDAATGIYDGFASGDVKCIDFPADAVDDNCTLMDGIQVCSSDLKPSPLPNVSNLCRKVQVTADYDFYKGNLDCYTDAAGNRQCPQNNGGNLDSCREYEQDDQCGFISSKCVDGAGGDSGNCYVFEEVWDCGVDVGVPNKTVETTYQCAGPVRCMGEDCLVADATQSQDFAQAVALLNTAQFMAQDMNCVEADGTQDVTCEVFSGKPNECKIAVGGVQDCCDVPTNTGMGTYVQMLFAVNSLDTAIVNLEEGNSIRSAYEVLREPITDSFSSVTQPFTSYVNNISGSVNSVLEPVTQLKNELVSGLEDAVVDALNKLFQDTGSNMIAEAGGGAAAEQLAQEGAQQQAETVGQQVFNNASAAMGYIMAAYTAYVVAVMVIQLIYKCEKNEFELAAQKEVKSCHYVGSYCASKVLGACIEKRESYCCYNSPLSRIINEQIRSQLTWGWGDPKNPQCQGLPMGEIAKVDWTKVDLSEWLGILQLSDMMPGVGNIDLEAITGAGNPLDIDDDRPNALDRTLARFDGTDVDKTRKDLADGMQFSVCPNGWQKVGENCQYISVETQDAIKTPVYNCPSGYTLQGDKCVGPSWAYTPKVAKKYPELLACQNRTNQRIDFLHATNQCNYLASPTRLPGNFVFKQNYTRNWLKIAFPCDQKIGDNYPTATTKYVDSRSYSCTVQLFGPPFQTTCYDGKMYEAQCRVNPNYGKTNASVLVSGIDVCPSGYTCSTSSANSDLITRYECPAGYSVNGNQCRKKVNSTIPASFVRFDYSCPSDWTLKGDQCERKKINTQPATGVN